MRLSLLPLLSALLVLSTVGRVEGQYEDIRCKCICPPPTNRTGSETKKVYVKSVPPIECNCKHVVPGLPSDACAQNDFCLRCKCSYESRNTTTLKVVVVIIICVISLLVAYMLALCGLETLVHRNTDKNHCRLAHRSDESIQLIETNAESNDIAASDDRQARRNELATTSHGAEQDTEISASRPPRFPGSLMTKRRERADEEEPNVPVTSTSSSTGAVVVTVPMSSGTHVRGVVNKARNQQQRWKVDVDLQRSRVYDQHAMLN